MDDSELKQTRNLLKKLINDQNRIFYSADNIARTLLNKSRKSAYEKDRVFYKIYKSLEDKDVIYDSKKTRIPFYTSFVEQKEDIDRSSALYSVNAPLQFFHIDVTDI